MFWIFWRWKIWYFWAKKLMKIWYLLITEKFLFWSFWKLEIRSCLRPKGWLKDYIYWLLKRSCFELFGDGKYGLSTVKKLMEQLSSFLWYSRTCEIWFFVGCYIEFIYRRECAIKFKSEFHVFGCFPGLENLNVFLKNLMWNYIWKHF